ncbi:transcription factor BIM2-like isoform X1 [Zingiber officinale]|nr:transcription factor BIM2-like isoform X1 [Zingiber officinale]XP_042384942.1 transcription factor BIM2-like isoform X1 [Zingiber officinale]
MESLSRSSGDEDELRRAQGSSQRSEMTGKVDGKSGEQKPGTPTTPKSKHSATEQRRRCKINDRFQILRDLIPQCDQKRDKASFLLEVIEYVKFLQEKVQKYETFPSWNQENEKLIPWSNNQGGSRESITDPSNLAKNGPQSGLLFAGKFVDNTNLGEQISLSNVQNVAEADVNLVPMQSNYYASVGRGSDFMQPQERLITDSENLVSHSQSEWQGSSCMADCTVGCENDQELTIDEGTINFSSIYSQGLLTTLSQAVASSGLDLSQASISVQINLGRRAIKRPTNTNVSDGKDLSDPSIMNQAIGVPGPGSNFSESEQTKRQKVDNS